MVHLLPSVLGWAEHSARPYVWDEPHQTTPHGSQYPWPESPARAQVACQAARASGQELQQGVVDLVGVGPGDGVRAAGDDHRLHVADQAGQSFARLGVGQDIVVIAMY